MTTEARKIQLGVGVNTSEVRAGFQEIKTEAADMARGVQKAGQDAAKGLDAIGSAAAPAAARMEAETRKLGQAIERRIAVLSANGSESERFRILGTQRGADLNALTPLLAKLEEVSTKSREATTKLVGETGAAAQKAAIQFNQYGKSVKETEAALRGVPAQLTDIFVGLQGGQNPLTVLLQQGGQLRDMFGGAVPAARALGGAVLALVSPLTVALSALGAVGLAYFQGSKEADAYAKALIQTGNAAGSTVSKMQASAAAVSLVIGTQSKAAEVLAQLASSGRVAAVNFEEFASVAIRMERVTGKAAQETVKEFAELGRAPAEAARRLNSEYNFLTFAVYEQIRALEDQGRAQEAADVAQRALSAASDQRLKQLEERLGYIQRAWNGVAEFASKGWDAVLGIGRPLTDLERLEQIRTRLANPNVNIRSRADVGRVGTSPEERAQLEQEARILASREAAAARLADYRARDAATTKAAIEAEKEIQRIRDGAKTNQQKLNDELTKYRRNLEAIKAAGGQVTAQQQAADEAAIRERFKDRSRPKEVRDDAATRLIQQLREQGAALQAQLTTTERLGTAERALVEFNQQIADLKSKSILTADQKSLLSQEDAIRAQLTKNAGIEREIKLRDESLKRAQEQLRAEERFLERAAQIQESIRSANTARGEQYDSRLSVFGLGSEARERLQSRQNIEREFRRYEEQLNRSTPKELLGSDKHREEVARIKEGLAEALAANEDYYSRLKVMQGDWSYGASEAIQNYLDDAANVAKQTEDLVGRAFQGMEDALVKFVTTGKLDFKDLANSIIADITRIIIKQQVMGPLIKALGLGGGGGGGIFGLLGGSAQAAFSQTALGSSGFGTGLAYGNMDLGAFFAKGGVVQSPGLSAYSGQIVDRPTVFPFAKGVGLMGEAGPEAILPLKRGSDGKLGVEAGNGQRGFRDFHLHQTFAPGTDYQTMSQAAVSARRALERGNRNM